jgi:hypothetical protein
VILTAPAQRILDAMRWLESGRIPMPWQRSLVAYSANHLPRSGSFRALAYELQKAEMISYPSPGHLALEHDGRELTEEPVEPFTRAAYWDRLEGHLGPMERRFCRLLCVHPHQRMGRGALLDCAGGHLVISESRPALAKLLAVELIEAEGDTYRATEALYPLSVFEKRATKGATP